MSKELWYVVIRAVAGYTWDGFFTFRPSPSDIYAALQSEWAAFVKHTPHSPRLDALVEIAERIPEDYAEQQDEGMHLVCAAGIEIGTVGLRKRKVYNK